MMLIRFGIQAGYSQSTRQFFQHRGQRTNAVEVLQHWGYSGYTPGCLGSHVVSEVEYTPIAIL